MSTVHASQSVDAGRGEPLLVEPEVESKPSGWANSGPLCLIAFAAVTFMISLVNAKGVSNAVVPMVISTGLIFGGATQLVGGLIQIRTGNTLNGALFSTFGGFWIVLAAYLEWFSKAVPACAGWACHRPLAVHVRDHRRDVPAGLVPHHDRQHAGADQPGHHAAAAGRGQLRRPRRRCCRSAA